MSESRWQAQWFMEALDAMHELVLIKGDRSRLLWANKAFRTYYGMSNAELEELIDAEHSDPDDTIQYVRDDHQVFTTGEPLSTTEAVTSADGRVAYYDTVKTAIRDETGTVVRTVGVSRPAHPSGVSESKHMRSERKGAADMLRAIADGLPLPVVVLDVKRRIVACSRGFADLVGQPTTIGAFLEDVFPAGAVLDEDIRHVVDEGARAKRSEMRFGDDEMIVDVHIQPWFLPDETIGGTLVTLNDVTELRASERRLSMVNAELERRNAELAAAREAAAAEHAALATLINALAAGVVVTDDQGAFTLWNDEASRLIGLGPIEQGPDAWSTVYGLHNEDGTLIPLDRLPLSRALAGEYVESQLVMVRNPDLEADRWIMVSARPLPQGARVGSALAVFVDITDRITTERELAEFAYVASHDLQEPLRMVRSYVDLLAEEYGELLTGEARQYMGFITDGASRMSRLIHDLLDFSRSSRTELQLEIVALGDVVEAALANLEVSIKETGAAINVRELPMVKADFGSLSQVFTNLIGNAIKFRHPERPPVVNVSAERAGTRWRVYVEDNGIGIKREYHDKVFRMFQRLHSSREVPGTGIGLALCKRLIERHAGRIGVESTAGGSRFWLTLRAEDDVTGGD